MNIQQMPNWSYNKLAGVMKAHKSALDANNFHSTLQEVGRILQQGGLQDVVGISLLHRHNDLCDGEAMVQRSEWLDDGAPALVTKRVKTSDVQESLYPTVWRVRTDAPVEPLEYCLSSDSELRDDFFFQHQPIFSDVAYVLEQNGLEEVLGLSLLRERVLGGEGDDYIAIESTDLKRTANVVTLRKRDDSADFITTLWRCDGADQQRCIPFKQCVQRAPGHDVTPGHEFVEGD